MRENRHSFLITVPAETKRVYCEITGVECPPLVHLPEIDGARSIWYIERQLAVAGNGKSDGEE